MKRSRTTNTSLPKKRGRGYLQEYLAIGFIASPANVLLPLCLICEKTFSNEAMKPSKMKRHIARIHPNNVNNLEYFTNLKEKFLSRSKNFQDICSSSVLKYIPTPNYEGGLEASYNISFLIAQAGYSHTIGKKLILPAVREILSTVMKIDPEPILSSIPLSGSTIQRRIDEMGQDIEKTLLFELRKSKFSILLDELTFKKMSILMIYVRYYSSSKEEITEEFLCAEQLETYTSGEHIFNCFENNLQQYEIPISNINVASCDGGSTLIGKYREFLTLLKNKVPGIRTVHCILYRQHLIAKNMQEKIHTVLQLCIKAINKIKTNNHLFAQLTDSNDETLLNLLLLSEVRWLSKGNCLQRFIAIYNSVIEFLLENDEPMAMQLIEFKKHVFFLTDIFSLFNNIERKLQEKNIDLIQMQTIIQEFCSKIDLLIRALNKTDFSNFINLMQFLMIENQNISPEDIQLYTDYLKQLKEDLNIRFKDIENLDVPSWIVKPFDCDTSTVDLSLKEELIKLKKEQESKALYGVANFWNHKDIRQKYIKLKTITEPIFLAFPSSYLAEVGSSHVHNLLERAGNRFNISELGDLRILLSNFTPDIKNILATH